MVLHDLNLAARYADHLVVMGGGRVLARRATRATVLTEELVRDAFGLEARIVAGPGHRRPDGRPGLRTCPEPVAKGRLRIG